MTLTTGRKGDADHSEEQITKFSGVVLVQYLNSIGGGDMDNDTMVSSTTGWGGTVPLTVYHDKTSKDANGSLKKTLIQKYENVKWNKDHPLKKEIKAKHQRHILILLASVDGKNLAEPCICQVDLKGGNYASYCKAEPASGRLSYGVADVPYKLSVESFHVDNNNRYGNDAKVQDFILSPIPENAVTKPIVGKALAAMAEVDPYIDAILAQGSGSAEGKAVMQEPDYDTEYTDIPSEGADKKVDENLDSPF